MSGLTLNIDPFALANASRPPPVLLTVGGLIVEPSTQSDSFEAPPETEIEVVRVDIGPAGERTNPVSTRMTTPSLLTLRTPPAVYKAFAHAKRSTPRTQAGGSP